jgi:ubiquitin carboxyl-terminal hydrolase 7
MIEPLKPKQSLKAAELQDGDIVCFQKALERPVDAAKPGDKALQEPYGNLNHGISAASVLIFHSAKVSDRCDDAREYYDFLEHRRTVKFHPHPTKTDQAQYPPFELVLNSKMQYDALTERVGSHIGVPSTHIRFWTVNAATSNPKAPVRRSTNPSLRHILNPMGTNTFNSSQRNDAFYVEVLEMSVDEFDTKKNLKLTWLSEGVTKEVCFVAIY